MLATSVNTRIAAIDKAKHPNGYDITNTEDQRKLINVAANGLFNSFLRELGSFEVSKSYRHTSSQHVQYSHHRAGRADRSLQIPDTPGRNTRGFTRGRQILRSANADSFRLSKRQDPQKRQAGQLLRRAAPSGQPEFEPRRPNAPYLRGF